MEKDRKDAIVHTMNPDCQKGPILYAFLQRDIHWPNKAESRHRLISVLWDHLVAMKRPLGKRCQFADETASTIQIGCDRLGRPLLLMGKYRGPAISFSEGDGKVWAALCGDASDIGIDVAGTDEFGEEYPFHRVFHPQEIQHASRMTGGDLKYASALLWSIKEAVVKALGCAFHLMDPLQIIVHPSTGVGKEDGYSFSVGLSGKALMRFPITADCSIWVHSLPQQKMWLSIALLNRRPTVHE
ncbi:MAG: 4'-phosphopantetheinyl transferase superfamily protein [Desulfatirhabdiaceae bacterium]